MRNQNLTFKNFTQEDAQHISKKGLKKYKKKHVKMFKIHDFSSLGLHISRSCANSAKYCAVKRP